MPISDEWTEWHLTPRGWERGSMKADGEGVTHVDPPSDRVLTICEYERQRSPYSQMRAWTETVWESEDRTQVKESQAEWGPRKNG